MKKQEREGTVREFKGRIKEAAGIVTGNEKLEDEGSRDRSIGEAKKELGKAREKVADLVHGIAKSIED